MGEAHRQDDESPLARLTSLRSAGGQRLDPARFHYLEVLSQRTQAASGALRRILEDRLDSALVAYVERMRLDREAACDEVASLSGRYPGLGRELRRLLANGDTSSVRRLGLQAGLQAPCAPLVQLNQYIRSATGDDSVGALGGDGDANSDMRSVRRFRETWRRMSAEHQVRQAVVRGPDNAGPLNSHLLVLRSLKLMREVSPDYLRRFVSYVDTLFWLDQASVDGAPVPAATGRGDSDRKRKPPRGKTG